MAEAAGVDLLELYLAAQITDIRDVHLFGERSAAEGCTAVLLPPALTQSGQVMMAQTWDLSPQDKNFIIAVERRPSGQRRSG